MVLNDEYLLVAKCAAELAGAAVIRNNRLPDEAECGELVERAARLGVVLQEGDNDTASLKQTAQRIADDGRKFVFGLAQLAAATSMQKTYVDLGGERDDITEYVSKIEGVLSAQSDKAVASGILPAAVAYLMQLGDMLASVERTQRDALRAPTVDALRAPTVATEQSKVLTEKEVLNEIYSRLKLKPVDTPTRLKNQCFIEALLLQAISHGLLRDPGDETREQWGIGAREHLVGSFGVGERDFLDCVAHFAPVWNFFVGNAAMDDFWIDKAHATRVYL
jgi:hypothetical protein